MSIEELNRKVSELRELRHMADELDAEITGIQDAIKKFMEASGTDELRGIDWKVSWKEITSSRFDSTSFKKSHSELYNEFLKTSVSRRFVLA